MSEILSFAVESIQEFGDINEGMHNGFEQFAAKVEENQNTEVDYQIMTIAMDITKVHALQTIAAALTVIAQKEN